MQSCFAGNARMMLRTKSFCSSSNRFNNDYIAYTNAALTQSARNAVNRPAHRVPARIFSASRSLVRHHRAGIAEITPELDANLTSASCIGKYYGYVLKKTCNNIG